MNDTLVDGWQAWLAAGNVARSTLRMRRYTVQRFAAHHDLTAATGLDIQNHISGLPGGAYSRQSHLAGLRSIYRWMVLSGYRSDNPTALLHSIKVPPGMPRPCPEDVLMRALARATDDRDLLLMLTLGAYAGLRRAEIAAFHSFDVNGSWLIIKGKGGITRRIPVHPRLAPQLGFVGPAFPAIRRGGPHIHPDTVSLRVSAVIEPYTCHSLRHRFATRTYQATRDIRAVQMLLGHHSPTTTQRYIAVESDAMTAAVLAVA